MRAFSIGAGRRVAAGAAAGAATVSSQPAHARAPQVQQVADPANVTKPKQLDDEWLVTELDKEVLLFKPYRPEEVESVVDEVHKSLVAGSRSRGNQVIVSEEPDEKRPENEFAGAGVAKSHASSLSTRGSEDLQADEVIEATCVSERPSSSEMPDLLKITSKLLQRPGMQREVFQCMLEDSEVRHLMLRQSRDLDLYLSAVGIHTPNLLPPSAQGALRGDGSQAEGAGSQDGGPLGPILRAVASMASKAGSAFGGLGGWLLSRFQTLGAQLASKLGMGAPSTEQQHAGERLDNKDNAQHRGHTTEEVIAGVMVVAVGILCVLLARRPLVTLSRRAMPA